tara:strand:- start:239 stop:736 length:498 start_codon:yes stop_codon:yes gene_type:complete
MESEHKNLIKQLDEAIHNFSNRLLDTSKELVDQTFLDFENRIDNIELAGNNSKNVDRPNQEPVSRTFNLPQNITIDTLEEYLKNEGFKVNNNRAMDGAFWVVNDETEFGSMKNKLEKLYGIKCKYYPNGRRKSSYRQYEIDVEKILDFGNVSSGLSPGLDDEIPF